MGGVFFRRRRAPKMEVINDLSGDVATFFRILQRHYPQFMDTLRFQVTSRREFERLKNCDPATLTDPERAARFLYLQRLAVDGKVEGRTFGVDKTAGARFNLTKLAPTLEEVHERSAASSSSSWTGRPSSGATIDRACCSTSTRRISAARGTTAAMPSARTNSR